MTARRTAPAFALLAALAIARAQPLSAQATASAASAGWQATPASVLKHALRAAAAAQARYRAEHGTYAADVRQLALRSDPGVVIELLGAGTRGWRGKATHSSQPGRSCVVFVGAQDGAESPRTDGDREMAGEDGVPLCDRMR